MSFGGSQQSTSPNLGPMIRGSDSNGPRQGPLSLSTVLKLLFMSGYTVDAIANHRVLDLGGVNFIRQPFSKQDLGINVREALDWKWLTQRTLFAVIKVMVLAWVDG
jgi:hypothetical protein